MYIFLPRVVILISFAAVVSLINVSPENSAFIEPSREIKPPTFVSSLAPLSASIPLTLISLIASISTPYSASSVWLS